MMGNKFLPIIHGKGVSRAVIPRLAESEFREAVLRAAGNGGRVAALFGNPAANGRLELFIVLADDANGALATASTVVGDRYPALTPECPQVHWFERELAEQWAVIPEGHPWLKPIRFHAPYRPGRTPWPPSEDGSILPGVTDYFRVEGDDVHEVAVGPVHAGIIEPGHFRFQCHGENVFHLEIELGFQHRGLERRLRGAPDKKTIHYIETAAGDTSIGHSLAYCHLLETLGGLQAPARALALRGIALELERLANHTGDLGALAGDVGFLPTASYCGRIRGDWLNMTAVLCGNRFGRGLIRPGGVAGDLDERAVEELRNALAKAESDVTSAVELLWSSASVMARFEETGCLGEQAALELGLVGPAVRACGVARDARQDYPAGIFRYAQIPVSTWQSGDVFARAFVRWMEIQRSIGFIREQLNMPAGGEIRHEIGPLEPDAMAVSFVEGWRGEICHAVLTDAAGGFERYKMVDPSFHNWFGLALAMRGQQISDFPLCNKSFNLSYCGHDL